MNIKKTVLLIISFCLLIIFLFPLVIMIYTSFIPQGNMTNIVKEMCIRDSTITGRMGWKTIN